MNEKQRGPVYLAGAIIAWAVILWFFTINNPSFVPVARMIFIIGVIPLAVAEWLKMKGIVSGKLLTPLKVVLILGAFAYWYFKMRL
ncbi:MAG: hypothetical protein ACOY46_06205 [Bacillota bacterium]